MPWYSLDLFSDPQLDVPGVMESPKSEGQWLQIIELVMYSGLPNKDGCQIRVNNTWNFELLESLLGDYHDRDIIPLLKFGWPLDRDPNKPLEMGGVITRDLQSSRRMLIRTLIGKYC